MLETGIAPHFEPGRTGDVRHSQAAIERAQAALGYELRVGLRDGLERTVAWICGLPHIREVIPFPRMMNRLRP